MIINPITFVKKVFGIAIPKTTINLILLLGILASLPACGNCLGSGSGSGGFAKCGISKTF